MNVFKNARQQVIMQIEAACEHAQREKDSVQLLAVSKTQPSENLREMYAAGQTSFGENYLQEALNKISELQDLDIEWHFIGHVQRNKTKLIAEHFLWVHGVDRFIIAQRLSDQRATHLPKLNICIQVNIDEQDSKDGCHVDDLAELVEQISQLEHIHLRGLMVIPDPESKHSFETTQQLFNELRSKHANPKMWDTLSMGMSSDLEQAIQAGSTMVRVGTALFGARDYSKTT